MNRTRLTLLVTAASVASAFLVIARPAIAVVTRHFTLDSASSLEAGEMDGTMVLSSGKVTLGAEVRRLEMPDVAVAYSLARGRDGTIYVGTGNDGKVFRLRGDQLEEHARTEQLLVSSLAVGDDGTVYAGTLPEGRIYAIARDGALRELAKPEGVEHVWALVWDARRSRLFAGTGPEGKVFAIDAQGRADVYWDSEAGHVMSLAFDDAGGDEGALYAGTSDQALVVKLTGPGRAEVVYDFPGNEITALAAHASALAVAANEFPDPPAARSTRATSSTKAPAKRPRPGKGRLWRVHSDGRAEKVYERDEGHFTSVQLADDGTLYAGEGKEGRIYRVAADRTSATWIDVDERQVLAIDVIGRDPVFVTGDGGALYRITTGRPAEATWTSKVLDARHRARFGQLTWRGTGTIEMQTRSGNTEDPNATWSEWSAPITTPGPVRSAAARFVQVRARFTRDPAAELLAVQLYYLPQNQPAVVSDVKVKKNEPGSSVYELAWDVDDGDGDDLRYRLWYRAESQSRWRAILREDEELTDDEYKWDTSGVPDGFYVIRVEASDENSNPDAFALRATAESEPIRIDNHPPRIQNLAYRRGEIAGTAIDSLGPIAKLEVAVDGGEWRLFFPSDGLLDTREEAFAWPLPLESGDHIVAVRVTDAGGNVASDEVVTTTR